MSDRRHTIRNLDPELVLEARLLAIQIGTTLGELINQGLEHILSDDVYDDDPDDPRLDEVDGP